MADEQTVPQTEDQMHAAFDALLDPTFTTNEEMARVEEPAPEPEPEPETKPAAVAAAPVEPPRVDRRTREGRKLSIQQEIDELSSQRHATKSEVETTKTELATLKAELAALTAQKPAVVPPAPVAPAAPSQAEWERYASMPDAPDITKFDDLAKYQFAVNTFVTRQMLNEHAQVTTQQRQIETQRIPFNTRIEAEAAKDATFTEKLLKTPVDTRIIPWLHAHPQGPDVMVYLVQHPEIAQRLTTLNPTDQVGQIGEIIGTLKSSAAASSGPASKPVPMSRAKPVIKPVTSSPDVGNDDDDGDDDDISVDEHIRRGNRREGLHVPRAASRY